MYIPRRTSRPTDTGDDVLGRGRPGEGVGAGADGHGGAAASLDVARVVVASRGAGGAGGDRQPLGQLAGGSLGDIGRGGGSRQDCRSACEGDQDVAKGQHVGILCVGVYVMQRIPQRDDKQRLSNGQEGWAPRKIGLGRTKHCLYRFPGPGEKETRLVTSRHWDTKAGTTDELSPSRAKSKAPKACFPPPEISIRDSLRRKYGEGLPQVEGGGVLSGPIWFGGLFRLKKGGGGRGEGRQSARNIPLIYAMVVLKTNFQGRGVSRNKAIGRS